jgi:hypothetical protein
MDSRDESGDWHAKRDVFALSLDNARGSDRSGKGIARRTVGRRWHRILRREAQHEKSGKDHAGN